MTNLLDEMRADLGGYIDAIGTRIDNLEKEKTCMTQKFICSELYLGNPQIVMPIPRFHRLKVNVCSYKDFKLELDNFSEAMLISPEVFYLLRLTWVRRRYPYLYDGYEVEWSIL